MRKDDGLKTAAVNGFTASPEIVGIVKAKGGPRAFSYVMADGRILPAIMGGADAGDGKGDGDPNAGAGKGDGDPNAGKVTFQPEQQARVQELIDEAYRKAYAKARQDQGSASEVAALKAEIEKLKAGGKDDKKQDDAKGGDAEWKRAFDQHRAESDAKLKEYEAKLAGLNEEKKRSAILGAVSKQNVVDGDAVARLIWNDIKVDENGGLTVQGESGQPRISKNGQPMTVDEFIGEWLAERPYLVRGSGSQGAGSQGAKFGPGGGQKYDLSDPATWRNMPREELDKLLKEGVNIPGGNGQMYRFAQPGNKFLEARRSKFAKQK